MKLKNLNQWLSLLANFGVMIGIIFLVIEVNQNTANLRALAIQNSTEVSRQQLMMLAQNEDVVRITMTDLAELSDLERQRYYWINLSFLSGMQGLYRQWETGILPDQEWTNWTRVICWNLEQPNFRKAWPPETLMPEFVRYVESSCSVNQ
jgi:hypothetical protein